VTDDDDTDVVEIVAKALCRHGELLCWETHTSDAARAIAAIESSGRWKIAPVEPTPSMVIAGASARPIANRMNTLTAAGVYYSMLSAAPKVVP